MPTNVNHLKTLYRTAKRRELPTELILKLQKETDLRYGENPHQAAALYKVVNEEFMLERFMNIDVIKSGKQGLSSTNYMDITRAFDILKYFSKPSVVVMKHANPSGFATQVVMEGLLQLYIAARDSDARSAFGGVVVFNTPIDMATAQEITRTFIEVVAAPEYEEKVLDILHAKKDLRVVKFSNLEGLPKFIGDDLCNLVEVKMLSTARMILQEPYLTHIRSTNDFVSDASVTITGKDGITSEHIVTRAPSVTEQNDLLTAWYLALGVRSNAIIFIKHGVSVSIGTGQTERIGAVEYAIIKAYQKAMDRERISYGSIVGSGFELRHQLSSHPLAGSVCASDGFFPFRDSVDLMATHGVTAVIQPGGSLNDHLVIDAVNEHRMAMVMTSERCFAHF